MRLERLPAGSGTMFIFFGLIAVVFGAMWLAIRSNQTSSGSKPEGIQASTPTTQSEPATQPRIGPAPSEVATVAMSIILQQFDPADCPRIQNASRTASGSIYTVCTNQERYVVFTVDGKAIAMRWIGKPLS